MTNSHDIRLPTEIRTESFSNTKPNFSIDNNFDSMTTVKLYHSFCLRELQMHAKIYILWYFDRNSKYILSAKRCNMGLCPVLFLFLNFSFLSLTWETFTYPVICNQQD
jgi:hypothetical protein